jgi:flagellar FliL protein
MHPCEEETMALKKKKLIIILLPLLLIGGGAGAYFGGLLGGGDKKPKAHKEVAAEEGEHGEEAPAEGEHGEEPAAEEHGDAKEEEKSEGGHGEEKGGGGGSSKFTFYELPDIVVNLSNPGRKSTFLKIKINLELANQKQIKIIEAVLPRIVDNLQIYLRELKVEDLQGSEGLYRLREELLHRVSMAAEPAQVKDVLFGEMIMQ